MFRYIAVQWNDRHETERLAAARLAEKLRRTGEWTTAFESASSRVFVIGTNALSKCHLLSGGRGIILGSIFDRGRTQARRPQSYLADESITDRIVTSEGKWLAEHRWGSYVLFCESPNTESQIAFRSPMGSLPCYYLRSSAGPTVYFSFAEDALTLGVLRFTPNWEYLGAYLTLHQVFSRITALDGVRMLIPGECHSHRHGQSSTCFHWNPCDIATHGMITDRDEAVSTLRSTVLTCAAALVSEHPRIVHLLSGGVDSSIILAAIRRAAAASAVVCLNLYYENSAADERKFARLAAARAGCELIEVSMNEGIRLEDSLRLARTVNPVWAFQCVANSENYVEISQRVGASAMSSALCGDPLFMSGPTTPAAAEFLKHRGLHPQLLRTVQIVSTLDGVSAVRVLRGAIRDAWFKNFDSTWRPHKEVNRQTEERVVDWSLIATVLDDPKFNNPWINAAREVPVGKRWQIFYLPFDDFYYDPATTTRYPERIDVTASQPVAEICLRIPTYVHVQNGWNRGVARDAFAQELPKEIYTRATKGNPMQWAARQARENVGFIRELLLDGELVRHGLLNRVKLEEALSQSFRKNSYSLTRLFDVINAETWLQIWRGAEHRAAAA